jgi:hypothetical protein
MGGADLVVLQSREPRLEREDLRVLWLGRDQRRVREGKGRKRREGGLERLTFSWIAEEREAEAEGAGAAKGCRLCGSGSGGGGVSLCGCH